MGKLRKISSLGLKPRSKLRSGIGKTSTRKDRAAGFGPGIDRVVSPANGPLSLGGDRCYDFILPPMDRDTEQNLNESTTTPRGSETVLLVLVAASISHLLNDTIQSLIPAIYPVLKDSFQLSFAQIGLITLTFQLTASLLQPLVGLYTDHRPQPFSLAVGMALSLVGLVLLAFANSYPMILVAAAAVGLGSSIFHPEASRLARLASGGRYGFAQSLFQVGGNTGQSLGPLLAALIIGGRARSNVIWFTLLALVGIVVLYNAGRWYRRNLPRAHKHIRRPATHRHLPPAQIGWSLFILMSL